MWFLLACNGSPPAAGPIPGGPGGPGGGPGGSPNELSALPSGAAPIQGLPIADAPPGPWPTGEGSCPAELVKVSGRSGPFCIQAYEASFTGKPGRADQGARWPDGSTQGTVRAVAGAQPAAWFTWYQAAAACSQAGLHLCTSAEWQDACAGPDGRAFPTPDGAYTRGTCAVALQVGGDPNAAPRPSGSFPSCHTPEGVYDLLGNVWEWTDPGRRDGDGLPTTDSRGGAMVAMEPTPCTFQAVGVQPPTFQGAIGFRCCAAVQTGWGAR